MSLTEMSMTENVIHLTFWSQPTCRRISQGLLAHPEPSLPCKRHLRFSTCPHFVCAIKGGNNRKTAMGLSSDGRPSLLLPLLPCAEQATTKPVIPGGWETWREPMWTQPPVGAARHIPAEISKAMSLPADRRKLNAYDYLPPRFCGCLQQ